MEVAAAGGHNIRMLSMLIPIFYLHFWIQIQLKIYNKRIYYYI